MHNIISYGQKTHTFMQSASNGTTGVKILHQRLISPQPGLLLDPKQCKRNVLWDVKLHYKLSIKEAKGNNSFNTSSPNTMGGSVQPRQNFQLTVKTVFMSRKHIKVHRWMDAPKQVTDLLKNAQICFQRVIIKGVIEIWCFLSQF